MDSSKTMSRNIWIQERLWRQTSHLKITEPFVLWHKSANFCRTRALWQIPRYFRKIFLRVSIFLTQILFRVLLIPLRTALTWFAIIYSIGVNIVNTVKSGPGARGGHKIRDLVSGSYINVILTRVEAYLVTNPTCHTDTDASNEGEEVRSDFCYFLHIPSYQIREIGLSATWSSVSLSERSNWILVTCICILSFHHIKHFHNTNTDN